jgi:hypothetical protein
VARRGVLPLARYPIARDRFNLTSQLTRQRQTLFRPMEPLLAQTETLFTTLQIAPEHAWTCPVQIGFRSQMGSHLGNTGPFWQTRVPFGKLESHFKFMGPVCEMRVPFPEIAVKTGMC